MKQLVNRSEQFTTIKELAELFQVSEWTIRQAIKTLYPELLQNGKTTYLNEQQATEIKHFILENKRLKNLEFKHEVTTRYEKIQILRNAMQVADELIAELKQENENLKQTIEQQKPAVEFYEAVTDSKDAIEMGQVAKILDRNIGRNNLFKFLRKYKILRHNNEPYQEYIDRGYFRVIEQKYQLPTGEIKISRKTLVYQKGIAFINKILQKYYNKGVNHV